MAADDRSDDRSDEDELNVLVREIGSHSRSVTESGAFMVTAVKDVLLYSNGGKLLSSDETDQLFRALYPAAAMIAVISTMSVLALCAVAICIVPALLFLHRNPVFIMFLLCWPRFLRTEVE